MRRRNIAIYAALGALLAAGALFFVLNMTNPSDGGPAVILLVLLLIYGVAYGLIVLLVMLFGYIYRLIAPSQPATTMSAERYKHNMYRPSGLWHRGGHSYINNFVKLYWADGLC